MLATMLARWRVTGTLRRGTCIIVAVSKECFAFQRCAVLRHWRSIAESAPLAFCVVLFPCVMHTFGELSSSAELPIMRGRNPATFFSQFRSPSSIGQQRRCGGLRDKAGTTDPHPPPEARILLCVLVRGRKVFHATIEGANYREQPGRTFCCWYSCHPACQVRATSR